MSETASLGEFRDLLTAVQEGVPTDLTRPQVQSAISNKRQAAQAVAARLAC